MSEKQRNSGKEEKRKRGKGEKPDREIYKEKVVPPPRVELGTC